MQISEAAGGVPAPGAEPCRFPKLEECAHFHYERVQLPKLTVAIQTNIDQSLHSQHTNEDDDIEWYMVQVTSGDECWLLQRNLENFKLLDVQLHQCIYDRKIFQLPDLSDLCAGDLDVDVQLSSFLERFSDIADNSINCGPVLNWLQMDNKGHRLLVPSEESRSINTPAVAAAYSVRRYVSQARDELNLEVGDMISVIDMASPGESMWWRGKRGFQVGFFPQHCVHIIGDKVPRNMPLPPPVVGSLALSPIKPVLRKHGKLITFFRSFILNRPSRRRLKQSGILKERVFGCDLGEHLSNSGHDIPTVLKCCAEFIEKNGIVDGIYRLSGITSNIQKLRNAFDEDRIPNLYTEDILQDIHSVASLLKMYFRELPNPLCTYQLYQSFVNAVQGCSSALRNSESDHDRLLKMREAVQKLPPPHYRTLEYLMRHLAKVAKHGANTGMTTRNVAIVWAPNLLRCAELEVGGVAALQGVGVQAVVTEFLICYAHLIFCDHLPSLDVPVIHHQLSSPKKCRPKSLAISTPTKLITLEEARSKHLLSKNEECNYIEVGGGPKNLPKKYHTVIELPGGARKRSHNTKRSPLGWRSLFSKARNSSQTGSGGVAKARKASTPCGISIAEKSVTESDLTDMKRKLRSVKSAESLTSGHSEPPSGSGGLASSEADVLGPLYTLHSKPPGHNRSVSHDSYFDTLQTSQNNSEGSLLDLSEIQLNFELEESEMRIFSEDESLVSSPRVVGGAGRDNRRTLTRARPEDFGSAANSGNPSPKKQARVVLVNSPPMDGNMSRKRTRLEDQLSDIQYIDCVTPENMVCTMAIVHSLPEDQPSRKSPRNSDNGALASILGPHLELNGGMKSSETALTPTPQSPCYKQLGESSTNTTPDFSPQRHDVDVVESWRRPLPARCSSSSSAAAAAAAAQACKDNNITTTISITYKSPPRSVDASPVKNPANAVYENVIERAVIPTSTASLPNQEAMQPQEFARAAGVQDRPKSLSALEDLSDVTLKQNLSSGAICDTSENISLGDYTGGGELSSARSSGSNIQYTPSLSSAYHMISDDMSLSEVVHSSTENLSITSQTSLSFALNSTPTISPQEDFPMSTSKNDDDIVLLSSQHSTGNLIEFSPEEKVEKRKSNETFDDDGSIYQQVKFFRRSVHEINELLGAVPTPPPLPEDVAQQEHHQQQEESSNYDSLEAENVHVYENMHGEEMKLNSPGVYENVAFDEERKTRREIERKKEEEEAEMTADDDDDDDQLDADDSSPDVGEVFANVTFEENPAYELGGSLDGIEFSKRIERFNKRSTDGGGDGRRSVGGRYCEDVVAAAKKEDDKVCVRELTSKFEDKKQPRRFYEKDSLPPCLRARNLKNQLKTRSLDEEEFKKEFGCGSASQRRKSLDESLGYKTNSLPKTLNPPKMLPQSEDKLTAIIHLAHSSENLSAEEEQKKRERIEKYKEERRKFLHDKYRSESFKEDKDVLLSKLKVFKGKEPEIETTTTRRGSKIRDEEEVVDVEEDGGNRSLKSRAAVFERTATTAMDNRNNHHHHNQFNTSPTSIPIPIPTPHQRTEQIAKKAENFEKCEDFVRHRKVDEVERYEKRRHTFETRERGEGDADRSRRVSLDNKSPRKEKSSPSYCIKDMKAIFESKSKQ